MQDVWIFLGGYALPLLTPGPNMVMVASVAVLGGWYAAAHLIAGLSLGAVLLAIVMMLAGAAIDGAAGLAVLGPVVAALALAYVAWSVAPKRRTGSAGAAKNTANAKACQLAGFSCGLWTSITNPVTGTYFASQFLQSGSTLASGFNAVAVVIGVLVLCALKGIVVATVFSTETARAGALRHEFMLRRVIATVFVGLSVWTIWKIVSAALPVDVGAVLAPARLVLAVMVAVATYRWLAPPAPALPALPVQRDRQTSRTAGQSVYSKRALHRARGKASSVQMTTEYLPAN
jgi:threonine/homoserine/homoserine lactone efflux protein